MQISSSYIFFNKSNLDFNSHIVNEEITNYEYELKENIKSSSITKTISMFALPIILLGANASNVLSLTSPTNNANIEILINGSVDKGWQIMNETVNKEAYDEYKQNINNQLSAIQASLNRIENNSATKEYLDSQINKVMLWVALGALGVVCSIVAIFFYVGVPTLKDIFIALK